MEMETWEEMDEYCESYRESDGFCWICSSCSGPSYCNNGRILEAYGEEGYTIMSGGNHDSCVFKLPNYIV